MEYKVCSLEYFLDCIQPYELNVLLDNLEYSVKISWEQTRFKSYIQAKTFSDKPIKLTDILKFSWDKEEKRTTSVSNADVERLKNKAQQIINNGRFSNET